MRNSTVSRRGFLKLILTSFGATILSACGRFLKLTSTPLPAITQANTSSSEPTATNTSTLLATKSSTTTQISTATFTPTATQTSTLKDTPIPACFQLLTPPDNEILPALGKVTFSWEAMPGGVKYKLEIILPTGGIVPFETVDIFWDQYIEVFQMGGAYKWRVTAMDASGAILCTASPFRFDKPIYVPVFTPTPGQEAQGGGGGTCCFLAGTKIRLADGSIKPIEDIQKGNLIKAYDQKRKQIIDARVNRIEAPIRDHFCEIKLFNGSILNLTEEHPLFIKKDEYEGWGSIKPEVTAKEKALPRVRRIESGDALLFYNGSRLEWMEVISIRRFAVQVQTYNLVDVEGMDSKKISTYLSQDVVVHNKGGEDPGGDG
jgi:hypothetical protein